MSKNKTIRRFLFVKFTTKNGASFSPLEIERKLKTKFLVESIAVCTEKNPTTRTQFVVGLHSSNASKHTFRKKIETLFNDLSINLEIQAKKTEGSLIKNLTKENLKILHCSGRWTLSSLLEKSRKKKKK